MQKILDYNSINWNEIVEISEESPTRLKWKVWGLSRRQSRVKAGHLHSYPDGKPKEVRLGYMQEHYKVHRIIWVMHHGSIDPNLVIDHLDGNPWNNKIENLRLVPQKINCRNNSIHKNNKTKITGVSICVKIRPNGIRNNYSVAAWYDYTTGKRIYKRKHFNLSKFESEQAALAHTKQYLAEQQEKQKAFGVEYTERHGK